MRLGKRTRRRGALDKALTLARSRAARLAASPPLAPLHPAHPRAAARLRAEGRSACEIVDCDASTGGTYEACERVRAEIEERTSTSGDRDLLVAADVFVHPAQIRRARHAGADGVILVARIVPLETLAALAAAARELGLAIAVEVRNEAEVAAAALVAPDALAVASIDRDTRRADPDAAVTDRAARATELPVITAPPDAA
jgi:hypothetical protein